MIIPFTKCHANGNDFILTHSVDFPKENRTKHIIQRLCCRHTGIGADGLFVISPADQYDFLLDYYNADGSWETLCANGSRCAVQLMYLDRCIKKISTFLAGDGLHSAKILAHGVVSMQMRAPKYKSDLISPEGYDGYFIDTGARHFISESDILSNDFVYDAGCKIRYSDTFQPHGINVNFYRMVDQHTVDIKTYEKGVETVMLSCASGSTAVVFHLLKNKCVKSPVLVRSSGGNLRFSFDPFGGNIWSEGPAEILFTGSFDLEIFSQ